MASVTSGKMHALIGSETFLPVHYFPVIENCPKRVILQSNVNKLRNANSKTQNKRNKKPFTNVIRRKNTWKTVKLSRRYNLKRFIFYGRKLEK